MFVCTFFTLGDDCFVAGWQIQGQLIITALYAIDLISYLNLLLLFFFFVITATTLTSWHLLVTFCSLHLALWMKMFEHKPFDPRAVMGFGILNGISIGLLNLSLGFNSVGFYQVLICHSSCYMMISFRPVFS